MVVCVFLRKLLTSSTPGILANRLTLFQGRRLQNFIIPHNRSSLYAGTMFVKGVIYWNMDLKKTQSDAAFKKGCLVLN